MAALDSNSKDKAEEEDKLYQWIYNMNSTDDVEEEEKVPSSPEHTPVDGGRRPHAVADTTNTLNMDALDNILGIPVLKANVESLDEKPWRKAGADISDYFNYGFDEESWKAYCKKQAKHHEANRKKAPTKIRVQEGHTRHGKEESCCFYPFSDSRSVLAFRESRAAIDVIGGQPGSSSRVKVCQSLSNEGSNTQVVTEISPKENRSTSFQQPPPFSFTTVFPYTSPQCFFFVPVGPSLSNIATLDSELSKGFDDTSTSLYPCSSGTSVSSAIPGSRASSAEMIDTAKAWECHIWQDMEEKCDTGSDRYKEHGHDKDTKRGRDRESCSSSHNSWEEIMRHWDTTERGHKRHSLERFSGKKEEWHRERRHRETSEGMKKSSCSSSSSSRSRRDDGEDRDRQSRHKHKKAKRNRKDKESNKMFSVD